MKISVIGCGSMGKNHARVLKSLGVLDYIIEPSVETKKILETLGYESTKIVNSVESTNSDAYVISTPTSSHLEIALQLIKKQKHILIEKPAAKTKEEIEILKSEEKDSSSIIRVGHIEQFNPAVCHLKNSINKSLVNLCQIYRYSPRPSRINDVDVWTDLGVHDVDIMLTLFGMPNSVNASSILDEKGTIVSMHAMYQFQNDTTTMMCLINTSWLSGSKKRQIDLCLKENGDSTASVIKANLLDQTIEEVRETRIVKKPDDHFSPNVIDSTTITRLTKEEPLVLEMKSFISALNGSNACTTLDTSYKVAMIMEATVQSSINKKTINFSYEEKHFDHDSRSTRF